MVSYDERQCIQCDEVKLLTEFYKVSAYGRRNKTCKTCVDKQPKGRPSASRFAGFEAAVGGDGFHSDKEYVEHYYGWKQEISYE